MAERIDRQGEHKTAFKKNKKIIMATQEVCGICGCPVDKTLKAPDPMSPAVDHIIPIAKGGHPSSLDNLQLAHRWCNMHKGDRLLEAGVGRTSTGKKTPAGKKTPGSEKDPALKITPGIEKPPGQTKEPEDNNDLPLHADWTALEW